MKCILASILLVFSVGGNASTSDSESINTSATKNSFIVTLAANPTTGFQWKLVTYNKNLFNLDNSVYKKPNTNLIGAGGQMIFNFSLKNGKIYPASTQMVFKYSRSWEPASAIVKNITVNFLKDSDKGDNRS